MKKILILGGGFGGIYTALNLFKYFKNNSEIQIILVDNKNYFLFTPLLSEAATGGVSLRNITEPIREIFKYKNFEFICSNVLEIDLNNKKVILDYGEINEEINYDYLVISLGSKPNFYGIKDAEKYVFSLKSIQDALKIKKHFINIFEKASLNKNNLDRLLNFIIVGGGPTGLELAAEMHNLFFNTFKKLYSFDLIQKINIFLIEKESDLLLNFDQRLRKKIFNRISSLGVKILLNKSVIAVGENYIILNDNQKIKTNTIIWTAGVKSNLVKIKGNLSYKNDRIITNEFLQIDSYKNVFAIGDCAYIESKNGLVPQLAQSAVAEAEFTALNIKNIIFGFNLKEFEFKPKGYLIPLGKFYAVVNIKNFVLDGFLIWILWRLIYISKIVLFENKIKTLVDWIVDLFLPRNSAEI